jgi:hypothetical protein
MPEPTPVQNGKRVAKGIVDGGGDRAHRGMPGLPAPLTQSGLSGCRRIPEERHLPVSTGARGGRHHSAGGSRYRTVKSPTAHIMIQTSTNPRTSR